MRGKDWFFMEHVNHSRFFETRDHALRGGDSRCHAQRLAGKTSLAKEITGAQHGEDRFLPLLGQDLQLDPALLDVEDRIGGVSLREDDLPPAELSLGFSG